MSDFYEPHNPATQNVLQCAKDLAKALAEDRSGGYPSSNIRAHLGDLIGYLQADRVGRKVRDAWMEKVVLTPAEFELERAMARFGRSAFAPCLNEATLARIDAWVRQKIQE